jgi:hypothetical protein
MTQDTPRTQADVDEMLRVCRTLSDEHALNSMTEYARMLTRDLAAEIERRKKAEAEAVEARTKHSDTVLRLAAAEARVVKLQALDSAAATHVESVICTKIPQFTGDPPYVGWKGLGLALREYIESSEARTKDAERYRWLRSHTACDDIRVVVGMMLDGEFVGNAVLFNSILDATIDDAIEKERQHG